MSQELAQAAVMLIKVNSNAESDELIRAVANVMGFRQAGAKFRSVAQTVLQELVESRELVLREGVLSLGDTERLQPHPADSR